MALAFYQTGIPVRDGRRNDQCELNDGRPMMNQLSGKERKETGQQLVLSVDVAWKEHAMAELEKYCEAMKEAGKDEFVFEDFRRHCQGLAVGEPHHPNAWGSLATCAAKRGLIEWTGRGVSARNPSAHARLVRVWRVR